MTNGGPPLLKHIILHGPQAVEGRKVLNPVQDVFASKRLAGVDGLCVPRGWSSIQIPGRRGYWWVWLFMQGKPLYSNT